MVTEPTRLTIVTDTGPCAAQGARHTWPLSSPRTAEEHLAQHQVGWFVTRTPSRRSAAPGWVAEGARHLSQIGEGVRVAHGERCVFLYGAHVTMMACYVRYSLWY